MLRLAYYPKYRIAGPTPANLPWGKISHLAYFNLAPTSGGGVVDTAGISLATDLPTITGLAHAAGVKVIVTLGGASAAPDTDWRQAVGANRATFVANIVSYLDTYGLDGVDIDWEPFDTSSDATDFALFIADLRAALPAPRTISVFMATTPTWKQTLCATIQNNVDWITLSTYDFSYAETIVVHDNPLYSTGSQPASQSVDGSIALFLAAGVARSKMVVGISHYAQQWAGETTLYDPATTNAFVAATYASLTGASSTTEPTGSVYDESAKAAYIPGDPFTSTPSVRSVRDKVAYIKAQALGGAAVWEIGQAYFSGAANPYPLLAPFDGVRVTKGHKRVPSWRAPYQGAWGVTTTNQTFTAGRVQMIEFVVEETDIYEGVSYPVGDVAAGSVTVGIYGPVTTRESATNLAVLAESASTLQSTAGQPQYIPFQTPVKLEPGTYFLAFEGSDAAGTYRRHTNQTQVVGLTGFYDRSGGYGALTNPSPTVTTSSTSMPTIALRTRGD